MRLDSSNAGVNSLDRDAPPATSAAGSTTPAATTARATSVPTRGTILVVDADATALEVTRLRLEGAGFAVISRQHSLGTAQAIADSRPDLVLLEQEMPALTGERLAKVLRGRQNDVPIIFYSRFDVVHLQRVAGEVKALGVIPKTGDDLLFLTQFERLFASLRRG